MHVIWKRPDGFHGSSPEDFKVLEVGQSRLWLHKSEREWYPFQIAGDWKESEGTQRLNSLVNLINEEPAKWTEYLSTLYSHSMSDNPEQFYAELIAWLHGLTNHAKGDKWEVEIIANCVRAITTSLDAIKSDFIQRSTQNTAP